jgi:hypothetical protein
VFQHDRFDVSGSAFEFNGINTYIELPGQQFNFANNMTVAFWANPAAAQATWARLFDKSSYTPHLSPGDRGGWGISQHESDLNLIQFGWIYSLGVGTPSIRPSLTANAWNHVAFTKSGSSVTTFLNGVKIGTQVGVSSNIIPSGNLPLLLGAGNSGRTSPASEVEMFFTGTLDEIFIFNRTLSATEVQTLYIFDAPTSQPSSQPSKHPTVQPSQQPSSQPSIRVSSSLRNGLVAFYPFDGNADDNSGNGNHGMVRGGMSLVSDRFGRSTSAYSFNGNSGFIEVPGEQFNFAVNMSMSFWISPAVSQVNYTNVFDKSDFTSHFNGEFIMRQSAGKTNLYTVCFSFSSTAGFCGDGAPFLITHSIWSHVVLIKSGKTVGIYINSNLMQTYHLTTETLLSNGNLPLLIGAENSGGTLPASNVGGFFHGKLDDIFFWNRALTLSELVELSQFDSPTSQPSTQPSGLPSSQPVSLPSSQPSRRPSTQPTSQPTVRISSNLKNGLIAYYPFDGDANDNSGNGNHGVAEGNAALSLDRFGKPSSSYSFNSGGCIKISNGAPFQFADANFTMSMWVNPASNQGGGSALIEKSHNQPQQTEWSMEMLSTSNQFTFYAYDPGIPNWIDTVPRPFLTPNIWNHVVAMKTGRKISLYRNGIQLATALLTSTRLSANGDRPVYIGCMQGNTLYFKGLIDEIFVFNRSLSTSEIIQLYNFETPTSQPTSQPSRQPSTKPTTQPSRQPSSKPSIQPSSQPSTKPTVRISGSLKNGLLAYYPFDGNADDNSGNGNHGKVYGGVSLTVDRFGNPQNAWDFDGSTRCVEVNGESFNFARNMSVSLWMKPNSAATGFLSVLNKAYRYLAVPGGGWAVFQNNVPDTYGFFYIAPDLTSFGTLSLSLLFPTSQWTHLAVTKSEKTLRMYVNGTFIRQFKYSDPVINTTTNLPLMIGCANTGYSAPATSLGGFYKGRLDDIMIFNRPLSSEEVALLYTFDSPTSQPTNQPSRTPTAVPSLLPSSQPTSRPTGQPSRQPITKPTGQPSVQPTTQPTVHLPHALENGLVAYYPFDGNVNDNSGNGNHGLVYGGYSTTTDRFGNANKAWNFDGSTKCIEVRGAPFNFPANMSVSLWINPNSPTAGFFSVLRKRYQYQNQPAGGWAMLQNGATNTYGYFFVSGHLMVAGTTNSAVLSRNNWNHLVFSKQGKKLTTYINGTLINELTMTYSAINATNDPLMIGCENGAYNVPPTGLGGFYKGKLDDILIYNRPLSFSEVRLLYNFDVPTSQPSSQPSGQPSSQPTVRISSSLKNGLVAYYPFDGNPNDNSGNGIHGLLRGGVSLMADRFGSTNNAYLFDGNTGYIEFPGGSKLNIVNNGTISFWINPGNFQRNYSALFSKFHDNGGYDIRQDFYLRNKYSAQFYNQHQYRGLWDFVVVPNIWSHIAIIKLGNTIQFYANGVMILSGSIAPTPVTRSQNVNLPLVVGGQNAGASSPASSVINFFNGGLDDIAIFNRSLSHQEVQMLFQSNGPTSQPSTQPSVQPSNQPSSQPTVRISLNYKNGLVAYYPFDGNANDNSGNGNHGTLQGNVQSTVDRFGNPSNAFLFTDSLSSCIKIVNGLPFQFSQANFTVSMWVRPSNVQIAISTLMEKSHAANEWSIEMQPTTNLFALFVYDSTISNWVNAPSAQFTASVWNHFVVMKSGKTLSAFLNNIPLGSVSMGGTTLRSNGNLPVYIGCNSGTGRYFSGSIDDIFVFNRSLTVTEIGQLYSFDAPTSQPTGQPSKQPIARPSGQPSGQPTTQPTVRLPAVLEDGLVAYYPFDGNANDNSGNGNHGLVYGGSGTTTDRFGNVNNAWNFDGSTKCIEVRGAPFNFVVNMSVSLWINPNSVLTGFTSVLRKGYQYQTKPAGGWAVVQNDAPNTYGLFYASGYQMAAGTAGESPLLSQNRWNHLVFSKQGKTVTIYVNGTLTAKASTLTALINTTNDNPLTIGCSTGSYNVPPTGLSAFFKGKLDDILIYNRPLSSSEVRLLYNFDVPTSQPSTQPSRQPSSQPVSRPSSQPSRRPSTQPTSQPTVRISPNLKNGLVAFYPFDGDANDNSGNGNHGIIQGNMQKINDRFGIAAKAFSFSSTRSTCVTINNGLPFQFTHANFSISMWVNPATSQVESSTLMDKHHGTPAFAEWFVDMQPTTNQYSFWTYNPGWAKTSPVQFNANVWNHFVAVKVGKSLTTYLNGELLGSDTATSSLLVSNGNLPLYIGCYEGSGRYFSGSLDDVFIFNRSLSMNDIRQLYSFDTPTSRPSSQPSQQPINVPSSQPSKQPTSQPTARLPDSLQVGLVAYYPFEGNTYDKSGNRNNGLARNGISLTADRFDNPNSAWNFDGLGKCIEVPGQAFNFPSNLSISLWMSSNNPTGGLSVLNKGYRYTSHPAGGWALLQNNNPNNYGFYYSPGFQASYSTSPNFFHLTANQWTHFVLSKQDRVMTVYLNGTLQVKVSHSNGTILSNGDIPLLIGCFAAATVPASGLNSFFTGKLDDIMIFNRPLSMSEVGLLYNAESPTSQPTNQPSCQPTQQPTRQPTRQPFSRPSTQPSSQPTRQPTGQPIARPSTQPSSQPTARISSNLKKGLVAYYPFDGNARDDSGNEIHLIPQGGVDLVTDRFGLPAKAYQFNGVNGIMYSPGSEFRFTSNMSLSYWIKPGAVQTSSCVLFTTSNGFDGEGWYVYQFESTANSFHLGFYDPAGEQGNAAAPDFHLPADFWTHVVITKNNFVQYYLNGSLVLSRPCLAVMNPSSSTLTVGGANLGRTIPPSGVNNFFSGALDDVFIFNQTISQETIRELFLSNLPTSQPSTQPSSQPTVKPTSLVVIRVSPSLKNGLLGYFPLDGNANDHSGKGNHLIFGGSGTFVADRMATERSALSFNGASTYLYAPVANFKTPEFLSVAFWMKPAATQPNWYSIFTTTNGGTNGWHIAQVSDNMNSYLFDFYNSSNRIALVTEVDFKVPANSWTHVTIAKGISSVNYYLNGTLVKSRPCSRFIKRSGSTLTIGAANLGKTIPPSNVGVFYTGLLDDIFIYNSTLQQEDIDRIVAFETPSSRPTALPSSQPSKYPSSRPTSQPTIVPSVLPTDCPSSRPSVHPSEQPSSDPTSQPSLIPTAVPSRVPSGFPTSIPTELPSTLPTGIPSTTPTTRPSSRPSNRPSSAPSSQPTAPIGLPSSLPSSFPSSQPSCRPVAFPSVPPSSQPTRRPTALPLSLPTSLPTRLPSSQPSTLPSATPIALPRSIPTSEPTRIPSVFPSSCPSSHSTICPSFHISTEKPSILPSVLFSSVPSVVKTSPPITPSTLPSAAPSKMSVLLSPSSSPSDNNSPPPTELPTEIPTHRPTEQPTFSPSEIPTTSISSLPSAMPSTALLYPTSRPSSTPQAIRSSSSQPSWAPILHSPTSQPTRRPSSRPSLIPFNHPSSQPTRRPTTQPSRQPITRPSSQPSRQPTRQPTAQPTSRPSSSRPTSVPSLASSAPTPIRAPSFSSSPSSTRRPTRSPTATPTAIPTVAPTSALSVLFPSTASKTAFKGSLFLLGVSTAPATALNIPDTSNIDLTQTLANQKSFIVFGTKKGQSSLQENIQIGSRESYGSYSELSSSQSSPGIGLARDHSTRSSAIVGDINNDGFEDLILGFPSLSTCFVYLGSSQKGFQNLLVSVSIYGATPGDEFGWSVSRAGDVNSDSIDDFIICAKAVSICYVLYGRPNFPSQFRMKEFSSSDGFRIIGTPTGTTTLTSALIINFGIAVDYVGDFNKDGFPDLVISAMSLSAAGVIFVVFGRPVNQLHADILIDQLYNSSSSLFVITTPTFTFAGLSVAGVGDMTDDGFADIAIGSVPYQGGYSTQRTYVIFGRSSQNNNNNKNNNTLAVNEMITGTDGFTITGGGFAVTGVDDVNSDGIDDLMITSFYDWQGKGNTYLLAFPRNISAPPTFLPSSNPSSRPSFSPSTSPTKVIYPTNRPSKVTPPPVLAINETHKPTVFIPATAKPSQKTSLPTVKKTSVPSIGPSTTMKPTRKPTATPSFTPSRTPSHQMTVKPSQTPSKTPQRFASPVSFSPTRSPHQLTNQTIFINGSAFEVVHCEKPGEFIGKDNRNQVFELTDSGVYHIIARSSTGNNNNNVNGQTNIVEKFVKVFHVYPADNQLATIKEFDADTDIIDLSKFSSIRAIQDLSYTTNPLKLFLVAVQSSSSFSSSTSSLVPFLSSHSESENSPSSGSEAEGGGQTISLLDFDEFNSLSAKNFVFSSGLTDSSSSNNHGATFSASLDPLEKSNSLLIVFGGIIVVVTFISFMGFLQADIESEKKEKEKSSSRQKKRKNDDDNNRYDEFEEDETSEPELQPNQSRQRDEENQIAPLAKNQLRRDRLSLIIEKEVEDDEEQDKEEQEEDLEDEEEEQEVKYEDESSHPQSEEPSSRSSSKFTTRRASGTIQSEDEENGENEEDDDDENDNQEEQEQDHDEQDENEEGDDDDNENGTNSSSSDEDDSSSNTSSDDSEHDDNRGSDNSYSFQSLDLE